MADKKLDRLLAKAEKAYAKGDKRKGARLIDDILQKDYNHAPTWALLHRLFGKGREFSEFQRSFTIQYYPEQLYRLKTGQPGAAGGPAGSPEKKPSFFARLFRRSKKQDALKEAPVDFAAAPQDQPPVPQAAEPLPADPPAANPPEAPTASLSPSRIVIPRDPPRVPRDEPPPVKIAAAPPPVGKPPAAPTFGISPPRAGSALTAARRAEMLSGRNKIHVIVVDDVPQSRETIIRTLRFQENIEVVGTAANGIQAIELVREVVPDVIIMDVNMPDMDGITATEIIKHENPHAQIIILTVQDDVDYIRRAMMAGARDFLAKPPVIEELIAAVQRAGEIARQEREKPPPLTVFEDTPAGVLGRGKIISVYSPRGGVGCTMLACNLAAMLYSADTGVALVDGNLQFGDVDAFFNLQSRNTIVDLAPRVDEMDHALVEEVLAVHPSGIKLLLPSRPERSELVTGPQFSKIITFLSRYYPYVIIDAGRRLSDVTLAALDGSDLVVLVTSQDIPSVARMRKFLDLLPAMDLDSRRLLVVMNQYEQRNNIESEKVAQAFRMPVAAVIPSAREVVIPSINRGLPFMLQKENSNRPIARAMLALVEAVRQRLVELDQAVPVETGPEKS